ncbi:MAG: ABC transporter permease [Acidobacteriia bacterium]|nr:ABC transporter permease [Terriglobia bacterium]
MMFWRLIHRLLQANRGRLVTVLLALGAGAAITAALLNLRVDADARLTREFRSFGANVVIAPPPAGLGSAQSPQTATLDESVLQRVPAQFAGAPVAAVPFLYLVAEVSNPAAALHTVVPAVVAGTHLPGLAQVGPGWRFDPPSSSSSQSVRCLVGARVASQFAVRPGATLLLQFAGREERCVMDGILSAGGAEDNQIFVDLAAAQRLAAQPGRVSLVQLSVTGNPRAIESFLAALSVALPQAAVRGVRQFSDAEARLYERIRGLLSATVAIILVLTALCVMAAMTNAAMERQHDVGLMKALGGPLSRILHLFLAEAALLGLAGGILGAAVGMLLSIGLGSAVFGVAAQPRWIVYPVTVFLTVAVAVAGAFPLRRLASVRPAVIFRGEA